MLEMHARSAATEYHPEPNDEPPKATATGFSAKAARVAEPQQWVCIHEHFQASLSSSTTTASAWNLEVSRSCFLFSCCFYAFFVRVQSIRGPVCTRVCALYCTCTVESDRVALHFICALFAYHREDPVYSSYPKVSTMPENKYGHLC